MKTLHKTDANSTLIAAYTAHIWSVISMALLYNVHMHNLNSQTESFEKRQQ